MNDGTGLHSGMTADAEPDDAEPDDLDPQQASQIMAEARQHATREFTIRRWLIFLAWSLVYLVGYGTIWLTVRDHHPYQPPPGWTLAIVTSLALIAMTVTASVVERTATGIGGLSLQQRRMYVWALVAGVLGVFVMEAGLRHAGASLGLTGVFGAAAPILVAGVIVIAGSALRTNWAFCLLGGWLIAVAAASTFAGPVGVWAVIALGVGGPFLLLAVFWPLLSRLASRFGPGRS